MRGGENNDGKYPHMISYLLSRTQAWYMANGTGRTAVRGMYRRIVPLSRMLHNGVGHGTPFVLMGGNTESRLKSDMRGTGLIIRCTRLII